MKTMIFLVVLGVVGYGTFQKTGNSPQQQLERAEKTVQTLQKKADQAKIELEINQQLYASAASMNGKVVSSAACGAQTIATVDMAPVQIQMQTALTNYTSCNQELANAQREFYAIKREIQRTQ